MIYQKIPGTKFWKGIGNKKQLTGRNVLYTFHGVGIGGLHQYRKRWQ